ncbi:MAG: hypothetical protein OXF99_04130 [bacterium]|nr:hypothetical protein [bacterium]
MTMAARREAIEVALRARKKESGEAETLPIQWKGKSKVLPVVEISVSAVLLNNNSHRIKANLESHEMADVLDEPFSSEAQEIIEEVIRGQAGYSDLLENIRAEGQRDPGVITTDAVLINANRRAVALRDIDQRSQIKVAVLPEDSNREEEMRLELKLQMQQEYKQSYTFTNELLFISDLIKQHYTVEQIATELRWKEQEVVQHQQMLAIIRDLQERCGPSLKLVRFDDNKREIMIELNKKLQQLERSNPQAAERLLANRALAMFADVGYELIREIDEDFVSNHLEGVAEEVASLDDEGASVGVTLIAKHLPEITTVDSIASPQPDGLDVLGQGLHSSGQDSSNLLNFYFDALRQGGVEVPGSRVKCDADVVAEAFNGLITSAAIEARESRRHANDLDAPIKYLEEARKKIKVARDRLLRAKGDPEFNLGDYRLKIRRLSQDIEAAQTEAKSL